MKSETLVRLYRKYEIADLQFGKIHDKLGDLYEEYCVIVLEDKSNLEKAKNNSNSDSLDYKVFLEILNSFGITNFTAIESITASTRVPHRETTHGLSKTDVIITINYLAGNSSKHALSCKQSTVAKMAFAEFDADTICREVGITDNRLRELILKHQTDKSAKNFTPAEKSELKTKLAPIAREFVRWVITGSIDCVPSNLVFPTAIIKFKLKKPADRYNISVEGGDFDLISFHACGIEEYIDSIMFTPRKTPRPGGFGTGLSWTYATGSGGFKIQFKA